TSMASPQVAGAVALLQARYSELGSQLSPQQLKSMLMTSAVLGDKQLDDDKHMDVFAQGAGRLDLTAAMQTGLTLNKAWFANGFCMLSCHFSRVITNLATTDTTWQVAVTFDDPNITASFPTEVQLAAQGSSDFELQVETAMGEEGWRFGTLTFTDTSGVFADANVPIAVFNSRSDFTGIIGGNLSAGTL